MGRRYRSFGEVHAITGSVSNNLRFPGQYFLIEAGLHYNWHRHYDPTLGRYLQPDPLGFVDGPSVYAYASSTPTTKIDPDGQNPIVPVIVGAGAISSRYPALCAATAATMANACLKTYRTLAGGGGNDRCLERWNREYALVKYFGRLVIVTNSRATREQMIVFDSVIGTVGNRILTSRRSMIGEIFLVLCQDFER